MKTHPFVVGATVLSLGALGLYALWSPSRVMRRSNCGGNSAALTVVKNVALTARVGASDDGQFFFQSMSGEDRDGLLSNAHNMWIKSAHILVTTSPILKVESPRRIIVVCDTSYRNVPAQTVGVAPPTHAAGFSDGSVDLISMKEFAKLDLTKFVPIEKLEFKH